MRKLLIVDPSLQSLEGHSYNYDLAIYQAARAHFDEVVLYADRAFRDPSRAIGHYRPVLNRLRIDRLKKSVNSLFHFFGRRKKGEATAAHSTIVPGVPSWMVGLAKWLRARDLAASLQGILREHAAADELHIFIQHAHLSELQLAGRWRNQARLHLVLRYSPELVNNGQMSEARFSALLARLAPSAHLYTDSERLSAQYRAAGAKKVSTLPVPIVLPESSAPPQRDMTRVAFLGSSRVEKGYCELPRLIEELPRELGATVQVTVDSADPRIRETTRELEVLARRLPPGRLELLESPVPIGIYYGWVQRAGIVALPYLSKKYNASTSGILVEALCFGVPVICPADSWMADVVAEAAREGLRIGEIVASLDEIPDAAARIAASIPQYRESVRRFAVNWRRRHNPDECVKLLLSAS